MLGIILCGGQSSRMGMDKGLLIYRDRYWAQIAKDKLSLLGIPVKLSVNPLQLETYANHFITGDLIADDPAVRIKGPLAAVFSAHVLAPGEDLFLLACDMVLIEHRLIKDLMDALSANDNYDAYIFIREGQQEPLCGIYRPAGLKRTFKMLLSLDEVKPSMKFLLSNLRVYAIVLNKEDYHLFTNFNTQQERGSL